MRRRSRWRCAASALLDIDTPSMMTSPRVGGSRPTTMRATVDLPEPDSPTRAKVSPLPMAKDTPSTALALRRRLRAPGSSQGCETSKTRREVFATSTQRSARVTADGLPTQDVRIAS